MSDGLLKVFIQFVCHQPFNLMVIQIEVCQRFVLMPFKSLKAVNVVCFYCQMISICFTLCHNFAVLARQVLVQSSSSSRARNKRANWTMACSMFQTMFYFPDHLDVHVLLLTHELYNDICPHCDNHVLMCPHV
jgi:hypothetical protein